MEDQTHTILEEKEDVDGPKDPQDQIIAALTKKMGTRELICPITGSTTWTVGEYTTVLPALEDPAKSSVHLARRIPLAVVMCDQCGYTFFVNLMLLGLGREFGFEDAQQ